MILVDARGFENMKAITRILRQKDGMDGSKHCVLLLIDQVDETSINTKQKYHRMLGD
jgi:hypothetical protein